ncbi:MAG: purine-binding chemotaxis protein CheW [Ignavibacteriae bacterium]|nr:purine-binding chemotaxis protein CheW [Ignavibacteriota bacterium]
MIKTSSKKFDWEKVKEVVLNAENLNMGFINSETTKRVLKQRAEILAREPKIVMDVELIDIIEFQLSGETYAFELDFVKEVCPLKEYTQVPCTPSLIVGVVNVRGKVVSVVDIRKFFSLPDKGISDFNKIILIENTEMQFGVLADSITDVCSVRVDELQTELPQVKGINSEYLKGVTMGGVIILNTEKILTDKNFVIKDEVV